MTLSPSEVIAQIYDQIVMDIPEQISADNFQAMGHLLGKLPNDYAYLLSLHGYARNLARQLKRQGEKEAYEDMMDKRDSLEEMASAVKLKYQAVSRMLSLFEAQAEYGDMYGYRKGREENR